MVEIDLGIPRTRDTAIASPSDSRVTEMEAGSIGEAVGGAAALVLAILALIGVLPLTLTSIAAIVLGCGMLVGGAALSRRFSLGIPSAAASRARQEVVGALGMQAIAGIAAVVLGILALLGVRPLLLLSISVLVLGGALLTAGAGMARLARSSRWLRGEPGSVAPATGWWEAEIGVGAVVLGILALTGHDPATLTIVALLAVGAALLIGGSMLTARLFSALG
jgi:hypothetical protein